MSARGWSLSSSPTNVLRTLGIMAAARASQLRAAEILRSTWVQELSTPGRGEPYTNVRFFTRGGRVIAVEDQKRGGRTHVASAPGDPPAPDSGVSRASIAVVEDGAAHKVGTNLRHLAALEWGVGVSGSKVAPHPGGIVIEPRPHARPAGEKAKPFMTRGMRSALRGGVSPPRLTGGGM